MKEFSSFKELKKDPNLREVVLRVLLAILLLMFCIFFIPWQQTVAGSGYVTTVSPTDRQHNILAPISGIVDKWYVFDGDSVKKGDPIVEIKDLDPEILKRLNDEKDATEISIESLQLAVDNANKNVKRYKILLDQGASSTRIYEQMQYELINYTRTLAEEKISLAKIRVVIARQDSRFVKASVDGVIVDRISGEGAVYVKETDVLATLVPKSSSRIVKLKISALDMPLIKVGDKVMLHFEGWPTIQVSGWPQISVGAFEGKITFISPQGDNLGMFEIYIAQPVGNVWPSSDILRMGIRVKGWVLLNNVTLGYEIWRNYNGFPININSPELALKKQN